VPIRTLVDFFGNSRVFGGVHNGIERTWRGHGGEAYASRLIDESANGLYHFFWEEYCSWYLELAKPILRDGQDEALKAETRMLLIFVLEASLRLLHPFVPFVTEELWQRLPASSREKKISIALAAYPGEAVAPADLRVEAEMKTLQAVVSAARTVRSEHEVHPGAEVPLSIRAENAEATAFVQARWEGVKTLLKTSGPPSFEALGAPRSPGAVTTVVPTDKGPIEVVVGLKGLVSAEAELARVERELKKIDKDIAAVAKKLSSPAFVDKAPKEVVLEAHEQQKALEQARARLEEAKKLAAEL